MTKFHFLKPVIALQGIHDLEVAASIFPVGGIQPAHVIVSFIDMTYSKEGLQGKRSISQPAETVIPVSFPPQGFRNGGCRCSGNSSGWLKGEKLQQKKRAMYHRGELSKECTSFSHAIIHPFLPEDPVFFKRTRQLIRCIKGAIQEINVSFLHRLKMQSKRELPIGSTDSGRAAAIQSKRKGFTTVSDDKAVFTLFNRARSYPSIIRSWHQCQRKSHTATDYLETAVDTVNFIRSGLCIVHRHEIVKECFRVFSLESAGEDVGVRDIFLFRGEEFCRLQREKASFFIIKKRCENCRRVKPGQGTVINRAVFRDQSG